MEQFRRGAAILATMILAAVGLAAALALAGAPVVGAFPAPTATPTPPPTVTLSITPHRDILLVGEILTVTADLSIIEGCVYPIFELTLQQNIHEFPTFSHLDPPTDILTGPIQMPSVWTFQATQPGTATFEGQTFGEKNCDGAWVWQYVNGSSEPVTVISKTHQIWIPVVIIEEK